MKLHFITLFPKVFESYFSASILGRAISSGALEVAFYNLADFSIRPTKRVDRRPYGGLPGMIIEPEPLAKAIEHIEKIEGRELPRILLSPRGELLKQEILEDIIESHDTYIIICGHYEGIDERAIEYFKMRQISLGEFVLSSGEIAAMVLTDGIARLLPGVIEQDSLAEESFSARLSRKKEYPQYTRPEVWRDLKVPAELLSGDPKKIQAWKQSFL